MANYFTCDTRLATDFPAVIATVSVSTIAYALHVSIAASALFLLYRQNVKNRNRTKHIVFITLLLTAGTANIALYLTSTTMCDQRMRQNTAESLRTSLQRCLENAASGASTRGCDNLSGMQYPWTYSATARFQGPDLTRGQDATALLIGALAQSYLLSRVHFLLARKIVTTVMTLLLLTVLGFGVCNIIFLSTDTDISTSSSDHPAESLDFISVNGVHIARISFGIALAFNLSANLLIVGRLLWLRARVTSLLGKEYARVYTGLAGTLQDSSTLYTTALIVAYTGLPGNGGTWSLFSPLVAQTEALAVELIILRIALGRSLTRKDVAAITSAAAQPDCEQLHSKSSISTPPAVRSRKMGETTFSQFPSSVAAVLRSNRAEDMDVASAHPDCVQLDSSSSIINAPSAPAASSRRNARRVRIGETFSQFPSSVADVLRSNRGEDTTRSVS